MRPSLCGILAAPFRSGSAVSLHPCKPGARRLRRGSARVAARLKDCGSLLETDVRAKLWLGGVVALLLAGGLCVVSPRLGGAALILLALGAVAVFAYRLL